MNQQLNLNLDRADVAKRVADIPAKERLRVDEVCNILRCDTNHVYRLIYDGTLDAANIARDTKTRPLYRIYRYSLVTFLETRREGIK